MKQFLTDLELSEFQDKLNKLTLTRTDNFLTRFKQFLLLKDQGELTGIVKNYNFIVWTYDSHLTGVFYPILYGTFTAKGTGTSVLVKSKLNEIGLVLTTIIYSIVAYAIITGIVIQVDNSFNFLIRRAGIAFLLFLFFSSFPIILYRHIRSRVLEFLTAELQLKKDPR